jgi:two-component system, LytTR family, response regulator
VIGSGLVYHPRLPVQPDARFVLFRWRTVVIRTLIVDDEALARVGVRGRLAAHQDFEVVGEAGDGPSAVDAIRSLHPDVVFLDIQLPKYDGFEVLQAVGPADLPVVAFVTAYDRYAVRAFETHALDYLLKPLSDTRFLDALDRIRRLVVDRGGRESARARLAHALEATRPQADSTAAADDDAPTYARRFVVSDRRRFLFVKAADVDSFTSAANYVQVNPGGHSHLIRITMGELEEQLDPSQFARIHRSAIVNIDRVKEVRACEHDEYVVMLLDGSALRMGRTYRHRLLG